MYIKKLKVTPLFSLLFLTAITTIFLSKSYAVDSQWSESDKITICKAYIGKIFITDTEIINHKKTDKNGKIYVKYRRPNDNSLWNHVCEFNEKTVIWAGWMKHDKEWGRWRDEDRAKIKKSNEKTVLIEIPNYEKFEVEL